MYGDLLLLYGYELLMNRCCFWYDCVVEFLFLWGVSFSDDAIQQVVLEAPWFKNSSSICAYISCDALREVDTSRIVSNILSNPATGVLCVLFSASGSDVIHFIKSITWSGFSILKDFALEKVFLPLSAN